MPRSRRNARIWLMTAVRRDAKVVLVRLHKRLHELRRDQPGVVALLLQRPSEEMRSGTRFEADQRSLHVRGKR